MKHAYIFPGQGSQFPGMGKDLFEDNKRAQQWFEQANDILGFRITDIMFHGDAEELKQTRVTQPAVFLHSVIQFLVHDHLIPHMVAGHSLGEFSALVCSGVLSFEDGLRLVARRAKAMQKACEINPSTMAAVLGLSDEKVEEVLDGISDEIVVPANYNCPGQLVISGTITGVERACELLKEAGARRALILPVGGAFHSPCMEPAREDLREAIMEVEFGNPRCPVYQNVDGHPYINPGIIRQNLVNQLTSPVCWSQSVERMIANGATRFTECGPGNVLQGLIRKINRDVTVEALSIHGE